MMSVQQNAASDDKEYDDLVSIIRRSLDGARDGSVHEQAITRSHDYLMQHTSTDHWFCNQHLYPIATYSLILFSFPNSSYGPDLQPSIARCLTTCENCLRCFSKGKAELRLSFATKRRIPITNVQQFLNTITAWESSILSPSIKASYSRVGSIRTDTDEQLKVAIHWCMNNPDILRQYKPISDTFSKIISTLINQSNDYIPQNLLPGLVYLLFEGIGDEKSWVTRWIMKLRHKQVVYDKVGLNEAVVQEFNIYLYKIQDPSFYTDKNAITFWQNFSHIVDFVNDDAFETRLNMPMDIEVMSQYKNLRLYPIIRLLANSLMSGLNEPLPILLKVFGKLLCRLNSRLWSETGPITHSQILDCVKFNPAFRKQLLQAPMEEQTGNDLNLNDLLQWMHRMVESVPSSEKENVCVKLSVFLLNFSVDGTTNNSGVKKETYLRNFGCKLLNRAFEFDDEGDLSNANYTVKLSTHRQARAKIDCVSEALVALAVNAKSEYAIDLITKCIRYDVAILSHNSVLLLEYKIPLMYDTFPLLWEALAKSRINSDASFAKEIIKCLKKLILVVKFHPTKVEGVNKRLTGAKEQHERSLEVVTKYANSIFGNISLAPQTVLKEILSDIHCVDAIWSCIFSPLITQSALELLSQVYEGSGRFECVEESLSHNFKLTLSAINYSLSVLTNLEAFEPTPKAVRIIMDVVKALTDPLSSILSLKDVAGAFKEVEQFWSATLSFLVMIYQKAVFWAGKYHMHELVDFTRDTLDLSNQLLESFRPFTDAIRPYAGEKSASNLFAVFMNAFQYMVSWLKLGDSALLDSCVALVFKVFDLAKDRKFVMDDGIIEKLANFGVRAKKFNNKLKEEQRNDIISRARSVNENLVNKIVENAYAKDQSKIEFVKEVSPTTAIKFQSTAKQQQTLARFGHVTSEPPVAPPPKEVKGLNSLENIRRELNNSRVAAKPVKPPAHVPAPPRPAGFNSKRAPPVIGRSLNTLRHKKVTSDSSDDEGDIDTSDLFVTKKKVSKITELDMNGKVINSIDRIPKNRAQTEKSDKERMRLRLNVDLKSLYLTILQWSYNLRNDYPSGDKSAYTKVKNTYKDVNEYVSVMEPLFMLECWQQIQSARDTVVEDPFQILVGTRTSVDGFYDVFTSMSKKTIENRKLTESDLLVIACDNESIIQPKERRNYIKSPNTACCLAKIREIKYVNPEYSDVTLRIAKTSPLVGTLAPKATIIGMRVMQMVTVEREFSSLRGLQYYDLVDSIISATPTVPKQVDDKDVEHMHKLYDVNMSQAKAIIGSYQSEGFSLIQGPPGTGKTKTILGIVGYSLSHGTNEKVIEMPSKSSSPPSKAKILICAPSNAAVDELVVRLRNGVKNSKGEHMPLKVVRLGRSDAINPAVKDLTLEELVDKELQTKQVEVVTDPNLRSELNKMTQERDRLRSRLNDETLDPKEKDGVQQKLLEINKQRSELTKKLDDQRERSSIAYRNKEIDRRNIQARILSEANILCATLSGSAHDLVANLSVTFDQVIIDEACQCLESAAIIPLRYGCKKCIMVGDPNQLPPTVLSQSAASLNYDQSLFVRMQQNYPDSVYLLNTQYRMHPMISKFPSAEFYQSKLIDGPGMKEKNTRPWHLIDPLSPYRFFDIVSRHEKNELTRSLFNKEEANVCLQLVQKMMTMVPQSDIAGKIGIISPYKEQIRTIKSVFERAYGRLIFNEIDFNTVDGFQGQEKEIIIMSCVRASANGNVGFLSDVRRMNVALTRACTTLWILGNKTSLERDAVWKRLLEDAEKRNTVTKAHSGFLTNYATASSFNSIDRTPKRHQMDGSQPKSKKQKVKASQYLPKKPNGSFTSPAVTNPPSTSFTKPIRPTSSGTLPLRPGNTNPMMENKVDGAKVVNAESSKPSGVVPPKIKKLPVNPSVDNRPNPTSSGTLPKKPLGPTSSGIVLPPKPKAPNLFIKRKPPPRK
ncbi:Sen1 helicase [Candida orthopsilosis Co 90-125]|uniref:Sen1 helicase n=1 Tax=Candida orthopsilosis (strain 90-125) TaxID=1136231 RepID=H8X2J8_CANO9|nr:Sen1 helicase [Candida orthopsilosis Co 90-125]CCG25545.1 Sen1 helicase [Candida orthopsilosis Co 90-125]